MLRQAGVCWGWGRWFCHLAVLPASGAPVRGRDKAASYGMRYLLPPPRGPVVGCPRGALSQTARYAPVHNRAVKYQVSENA